MTSNYPHIPRHPNIRLAYSRNKHKARSFLSLYPELFFPLVKLKESKKLAVGKHTQIVIEGFPRSGNSFVVGAFEAAQPNPVVIAHHLHAPAQIIQAARQDIPTLVLAREPVGAVVSRLAMGLEVNELRGTQAFLPSLSQLLRTYIGFYTRILPYQDQYVLGLFEEVTRDLGTLIKKINQKFQTNFSRYEHTEDKVQSIFRQRGIHAGPSERRNEIKVYLQKEIASNELKPLVKRAETVYQQLEQLSKK